MKKIILIALAGLAVITSAEAKHFGAAGCGLGSMVFHGNNSTASQVIAATTNGTSYSQTFGITSGSSNCTDEGTVARTKEVPLFIEANESALANDIARGNGETLENLSKVMGCPDADRVNLTLQKNYNSIFTTENIKTQAVSTSIINIVKRDAELANSCTNIVI